MGGIPLMDMDSILCWYVRGVNRINKQSDVKHLLNQRLLGIVSLIETKVKASKMGNLYLNLFPGWCFCSNSSFHPGGRIIVAWNPLSFIVNIELISDQMIHCKVSTVGSQKLFGCSFVYDFNSMMQIRSLWVDLVSVAEKMKMPWIVMGDFSCILNREERIGAAVRDAEMEDFRRCVVRCNLEDIKSTGSYYT